MRTILLFLSIVFFKSVSIAQTGTLGSPTLFEFGAAVVADNQGNSYIGGASGNQAWILKRNPGGAIIWSRTIDVASSGGVSVSDIIKIGDTIFGCGYLTNSGGYCTGSLYFKMNAITGQSYWNKFEQGSKVYFARLHYYQGKLILTGAKADIPSDDDYDGKVISVSASTGNMIWETPLFGIKFTATSADYIDDFMSSSEVVNGKIYLTGRSYVDGAPINMRATLIGLNVDNGTIFMNKYLLYDIDTDFSRMYGTQILVDGNEIVIGFTGDFLCSSCSNFRMGLIKCDLTGNVVFAKYYDISGVTTEIIRGLLVTPTSYILYGQATTGSNMEIALLKTDKNGVIQQTKLVSQATGNLAVQNGLVNFGGSCDYRNGKYYFAGSYFTTSGASKDLFQLTVNESLIGDNSCYTFENGTVTTTSISPLSENLIIILKPHNLTFQTTVNSTNIENYQVCTFDPLVTHNPSCTNDIISVTTPGTSGLVYGWSNGMQGQNITVTSHDTLSLTIFDPSTCCTYSTVVVPEFLQNNNNITVELPGDTTVCLQETETLTVTAEITSAQTNAQFEWNSGETSASIDIATSGTYIVRAFEGCSENWDTIVVVVNPIPVVELDNNLQICEDDFPYQLVPEQLVGDVFSWSTGSTGTSAVISNPGTYYLTASNNCGTAEDSVSIVKTLLPTVTVFTPFIDTCLLSGQTILLAAGSTNASGLLWNTGSDATEISVYGSGTYTVQASNNCGTAKDSSLVIIAHPSTMNFPDIIYSCIGYVELSQLFKDSSFVITSPNLDLTSTVIEESGLLYISQETTCGTFKDTLFLDITASNLLYLPNSFTPNGDDINEIYKDGNSDLVIVNVSIFDRWGETVYYEENSFSGWDGTFDGNKCQDGVYQVVITYQDCGEINHIFAGHVVLLR